MFLSPNKKTNFIANDLISKLFYQVRRTKRRAQHRSKIHLKLHYKYKNTFSLKV